MNHLLRDPLTTLNESVGGFRQYVFSPKPSLRFASQNLCVMLLAEQEALLSAEDGYRTFVHPEDRERYDAFLSQAQNAPGRYTAVYRLVKADGESIRVSDSLTSWIQQDGSFAGEAVLTELLEESDFYGKNFPFGFMKCTCQPQPQIKWINDRMLEILHISPSEIEEELGVFNRNIFLMVPAEERRRFEKYLQQVERGAGTPLTGEMTLLRCDGSKAHVFGWVSKVEAADGTTELQAVCVDVSKRRQAQKEQETRQYLKALTEVYDKIFQYDLSAGTVTCIHDTKSSRFYWLQNIPMQMEEATNKWIEETVVPEQKEEMKEFFYNLCHGKMQESIQPPRISYQAISNSGDLKKYSGIVLKMDESVSLYCCRRMEEESLSSSSDTLLQNMQELMKFTDGIAAFQITGQTVKPLYITDNICQFFGRTREEWTSMMQQDTSIREFVSHSKENYNKFEALLRTGEAEFSYLDVKSGKEQKMRAICSHKSPKENSPRYVMLYHVADENTEKPLVSIRTFGYFDVFVGDSPIAFRHKKSKELFALLVDRQGGFLSSEEAISFLWEDEPVCPVTLARYRKVALRLKNILEEYGVSEVMETVDGKRRIVPQKVKCDLYDYLSGKEEYSQLFKGSYLNNYSWGENTLGELMGELL